jgi:hypothetical protein
MDLALSSAREDFQGSEACTSLSTMLERTSKGMTLVLDL